MKQYGMNKATEFTSKQISVIYGKAKRGELKVEKWFIKDLYDLAEYYGCDYNGSVAYKESKVIRILESIFSNDNEKAQTLIDEMSEDLYASYGKKYQAQCDRTAFVA